LGNYLGSPHTYRIDWKTNSIDFYVDDILKTTVTVTIPDSMNVAVSDNWSAAPSLTVDWLRMDPPYASPCTFESRILDAGVIVDWQELISVKSTPAGTTVAFQTRSGTEATPDGTWSEWEAVDATIASPNGRYIQYQATLTSTDPALTPVIESVTLTHVPVSNTAPAAQGDTYTVDEDTTLNIAAPGVLENDTDADGDPLTAIKATDPVHGDLTFNGDGSFTYTPVAGFSGSDSFTYKANDGAADSNVATVNITVNAVNDAPTDISLSVQTVAENAPVDTVVGTLSSTDPDAGDTFTYTLVSGAGDSDNASFNISGDSLRTSEVFDYETKSSYSVRVRTTDQGGLFFEKQFVITITDVVEAFSLTVSKTGSGLGTVTSDPVGIDCGEDCSESYNQGTLVTLTATASPGSTFTGWSGAGCSGTGSCNITVDAVKSVSANFDLIEYTLDVTTEGSGKVTKDPDKATYSYGEEVTLTVTPDLGWSFSGWSGDATGSTDTVTITITGNTTVTATLTQNQYTLTTTVVGSGTVIKVPDKTTYAYGEEVTLTATPALGWTFSSWSGGTTGSISPVTITITGNTTVTATFTQNQYTLTTNVVGSGTVTKVPDKTTYVYGESVELTAVPAAGWTFSSWSGGTTGSISPVTITITGNTTVTATFIMDADTTPPQRPENLTAGLTSVSIVLDWADNTEVDLAGYKVYRRVGSDVQYTLLTSALLTASYFEDRSAPAGVTSYYRVTAVDTSANESYPAEVDRTRTIAFRAASSSTNRNGPNLVIPRPDGLQNGDFLLAIVTFNGSPTVTAPTGWILVRTDQAGTAVRQAVYYRFVGSGEPSSYSWTFSSRVGASGGIVAYSGVHADAPLDSSSGQANSSAVLYTAPQLTTSSLDSLLVAAFGVATNAAVAPPVGMIEQFGATMTVGKDKLTTEVADQIQAQAGASGQRTASGDKAAQSIGQLLAIRPSIGEPPPPPPQDTEPPTTPTGLTAQALSPYQVDLTWSASTDNVGVAGYTIYRDGTSIASVTQNAYSDSTLLPETTYAYSIVAYDAAGNKSAPSDSVSVTTPALPPPPPAGIQFVTVSAAANPNNSTNLVINRPNGAAAGHFLLASIDVRSGVTVDPPAGWTQLLSTKSGNSLEKITYYRFVVEGEPASYVWSFNGVAAASGVILAYSGVDVTNPIDAVAGQANTSSTTLYAPSVTTVTANTMLVALYGISTNASIEPPASMTERAEVIGSSGKDKVSSEAADQALVDAGATGDRMARAAKAGVSVGQLIALRPAE
jgi:VCBS repeat-containing protein